MACKLYIKKLSDDAEVVTRLETTHDNVHKELEDSGLLTKSNSRYILPKQGTVRYYAAKDMVSSINNKYGKTIVGINTTVKDHYAFVNVANLVPSVSNDMARLRELGQKPTPEVYVNTGVAHILNSLALKFGIGWSVDNYQDEIGRYEDGRVYINMNKVKADTAFHEFAHPFEQTLKKQNPTLWNSLAERAKAFKYNGRSVEDYVSRHYPELEGDDLTSEVIVTSIGLSASNPSGFSEQLPEVKGWVNQFMDWVMSFFNKDKVKNLNVNTTIGELAEMMRSSDKIQIDNNAFAKAYQKTSMNEALGIKQLRGINKDVTLNVSDPNDTFYEKAGKRLERLTAFIADKFSSPTKQANLTKNSPAESRAIQYYRSKNTNTSQDIVWDETGNSVSYSQLISIMDAQLKTEAKNGTILHAIIENFVNPSEALQKKINDLIIQTGADPNIYKWLSKDKITRLLTSDLGLNVGADFENSPYADALSSEVIVASDLLRIGSTIDMIVEHSNGAFSILDFKTGSNLMKDAGSSANMQFTALVDDIMSSKDTRINKAKMELMLRALIMKEQIPTARFRNLQVVHLGFDTQTGIHEISMKNYLSMIEEYYKTEEPDTYKQMQDKGLFNFRNYTSESKSYVDILSSPEYKDKTPAERADMLALEIEQLRNSYEYKGKEATTAQEAQLKAMTEAMYECRGLSTDEAISDSRDMGDFEKLFGTFYDVANPIIQHFVRFWQSKKHAANQEYLKIRGKNRQLVAKLLAEHSYLKGLSSLNPGSLVYHAENGKSGLYDFMWKQDTISDVKGWYRRVITKDDVAKGNFTQTQYEYSKWFDENIKALTNDTLGQIAYDRQTKGQKEGFSYYDGFMPRIPIGIREVGERHGIMSEEYAKSFYNNHVSFFTKEQYTDLANNRVGMPLKYMGSRAIIASNNFTFNAEEIMNLYAENMISKKYMDPVYAFGKGTLTVLKNNKDSTGREQFKRTSEWLDSVIEGDIAGKREELKVQMGTKNVLGVQVDATRVMRAGNNVVTASSMGLNLAGASFNAVMQTLLNVKRSLVNTVAELKGIKADYNFKDLAKGMAIYHKEGLLGKLHENTNSGIDYAANSKMYRFSEMMRFSTNIFRGSRNPEGLMTAKAKTLSKSVLYLGHSIGEEGNAYSTMVAMLVHKKVNDKADGSGNWIKIVKKGDGTYDHVKVGTEEEASSFYDAYEIGEDDSFEYKGPTRGIMSSGEKITGLTSDEINKMRRATQRINGSYREDEKTFMERTWAGEWLMKFKKYLPTIIQENFQGKFNDWSLGELTALYEDGKPKIVDGQTVYEWQSKVNEGRVNVMMKCMIASMAGRFKEDSKFDSYRWKNLSAEQKKQIYDVASSVAFWALTAMAGGLMFDHDEDKNTELYKRWMRLQEDMIQVHPMDLLRQASSPLLQTQLAYKTLDATSKFMWDGVIMGQTIESGKSAGKKPGTQYLTHHLPYVNILTRLEAFNEDSRFVRFLHGVSQ